MQNLTTKGRFPHGLDIAGVRYNTFEMRESFLSDMIDAEVESGGPGSPIHYNSQLAVRQLTSVTSEDGREFKGPFLVGMIRKRCDFTALRQAQIELDKLGNAAADASLATGTQSS